MHGDQTHVDCVWQCHDGYAGNGRECARDSDLDGIPDTSLSYCESLGCQTVSHAAVVNFSCEYDTNVKYTWSSSVTSVEVKLMEKKLDACIRDVDYVLIVTDRQHTRSHRFKLLAMCVAGQLSPRG